jgi:hypothetical protein
MGNSPIPVVVDEQMTRWWRNPPEHRIRPQNTAEQGMTKVATIA